MTPNERAMIEELFARIGSTAMPQRDAEAERLIGGLMATTPGAAYALAQTVLVQDQALREAAERLRQAEARQADEPPAAPQGGGLLDRFGLGTQRPGGVPRTGPSAEAAPMQASPGGSFLGGALQTAAGVAGGALLFEGIKNLFGSEAQASEPSPAASSPWGDAKDDKDSGFQTGDMDDKSGKDDDEDHAAHDDDDDDDGVWGDDGGFDDGGDGGGDV